MLKPMVCPTCFNRSFRLRFSKKNQSPFFRCGNCCTNLFVRTKLGVVSILSWCEALERIDKGELKNFIAGGLENFQLMSQTAPQLTEWEKTEAAQEMMPEMVEEMSYGS